MRKIYAALLFGATLSMLSAFLCIVLGVAARELHWDIQGLDAYAGYSIAAALFLAMPATLQSGDHIRVSLITQRLGAAWQRRVEWLCLISASALSIYLAWFSCRLVWISHVTHDVSPAADATPLWIPQISMAVGCIGLALAFLHATVCHARGIPFFSAAKTANVE